jgi:hypothetical protein
VLKKASGWRPRVSFPELVERMVDADLKLVVQSGAWLAFPPSIRTII